MKELIRVVNLKAYDREREIGENCKEREKERDISSGFPAQIIHTYTETSTSTEQNRGANSNSTHHKAEPACDSTTHLWQFSFGIFVYCTVKEAILVALITEWVCAREFSSACMAVWQYDKCIVIFNNDVKCFLNI